MKKIESVKSVANRLLKLVDALGVSVLRFDEKSHYCPSIVMDVEKKYTRDRFSLAALEHGLDAPKTKAAYDAMVIANGPNPPVPESWGKL